MGRSASRVRLSSTCPDQAHPLRKLVSQVGDEQAGVVLLRREPGSLGRPCPGTYANSSFFRSRTAGRVPGASSEELLNLGKTAESGEGPLLSLSPCPGAPLSREDDFLGALLSSIKKTNTRTVRFMGTSQRLAQAAHSRCSNIAR